jgi:hypothetical protein
LHDRHVVTVYKEAGRLQPGRKRIAGTFSSQNTTVLYYVILLTGACLVELKFVSSRHKVDQQGFMKFAFSDMSRLFL